MMPFHWLPEHVAAIRPDQLPTAPAFARAAVPDVLPGHDVWDHWPILTEDGAVAAVAGGTLVIALVAPKTADPEDRHTVARMRLFHRVAGDWRDLGALLPDRYGPGSREWSGSATVSAAGDAVRLFFTAVGTRGEPAPSMTQRLFEARADLRISGGVPHLENWSAPVESVRPDGIRYETEMAGGGAIGTIKAFRDPFFLRDPGGRDWLLFTGSDPRAASPWNGVIGAARWTDDAWALQAPIVSAAGLNNELERPHAIFYGGSAYLFWSTQAKVFAHPGPAGPTGLYGVVADRWGAEWHPINGSGLVFANPPAAPAQAYSFQVLPDLSVWSFADMPGPDEPPLDAAARRAVFVGGTAPVLRLALEGDRAALVPSRGR